MVVVETEWSEQILFHDLVQRFFPGLMFHNHAQDLIIGAGILEGADPGGIGSSD